MDGMTGRGVLTETEEEREPSGTMADIGEGGGRGGGRQEEGVARVQKKIFVFTPSHLAPPPHIWDEKGTQQTKLKAMKWQWGGGGGAHT